MLVLVLAVLAVDAAAIGLYSLAGLEGAGPRVRIGFTIAWTLATLVVVLIGLTRMRASRERARRDTTPPRQDQDA